MKTILKNMAIVAVLALVTHSAVGATIQEIIDDGGSITVGNLTFSDFCVQGTSAGGNTPMAQFIDIDFEESPDGMGMVLNFHGGWSADGFPTALVTSNISYKVTVADGYAVTGSELALISSTILGDAFLMMNEGLYDGDPTDPDSILFAEHLLQEGLGDDVTGDSAEFAPITEFYVNTGLYLRVMEDGSIAQVTEFGQTFMLCTVPEPATIVLVGLGGLGLLLKRQMRRH